MLDNILLQEVLKDGNNSLNPIEGISFDIRPIGKIPLSPEGLVPAEKIFYLVDGSRSRIDAGRRESVDKIIEYCIGTIISGPTRPGKGPDSPKDRHGVLEVFSDDMILRDYSILRGILIMREVKGFFSVPAVKGVSFKPDDTEVIARSFPYDPFAFRLSQNNGNGVGCTGVILHPNYEMRYNIDLNALLAKPNPNHISR